MEDTTQSNEGKRPYHSRVRQRQAEETRQRIIAAARSLFASRGYAATTLEAIAEVADVSPKTLGAVFGSKRARLSEVINPDAFSIHVWQLIEEVRVTKDPSRRLALVAQITRQAYEPLVSEQGVLRSGLSFEKAADVLWALTSFDLYRMLVVEHGFEPEHYEAWLAQLLVQQLLASAVG